VSYHALGHLYLLAVIQLCLRVGRGPVLFAAILSGAAWDCVFIPPRFSLHLVDFDDGMLLGIYFTVALIAGQFTARIRAQERQREQRATALFHLARTQTEAGTLDEAIAAALRQAEELFHG
jgi:two-component system sensor histidine kinase KdpD